MTLTTPNRGLPYPELGDSADVPRDIKALALALDSGGASGLNVLSQAQVRDIGEQGQRRAGRVLTATDFTNMGLSAPLGLWNLGDLTDASGNGRVLSNKGGVAFTSGITGAALEAAQFAGSTGQALYIADTGAADPFRIKTGSWGCWFRTAKRGAQQRPLSKLSTAAGNFVWDLFVDATNVANADVSLNGTALFPAVGVSDVCDDRWHFIVATIDGTTLRLYVDGAVEGRATVAGPLFAGNGPLNIGGYGADGSTAAGSPHYGRVDEAFVTSDVLSDAQVLNLYCTRITHTLVDTLGSPAAPTGVLLNVRRRKRGGPLTVANFPAQPVRLHNFTAGALTDLGSNGVTLTSNPGTGAIVSVAGADGTKDGAYSFSGAHTGLSATDTGLPAGTSSRSYGCWFKGSGATNVGTIFAWGTVSTADARFLVSNPGTSPTVTAFNAADQIAGPAAIDGLWHQAIIVEDNAAGDGVKRKLYIDARLVGGSTVLNSITLAGANRFRLGANQDGSSPWTGQVDGAFVHAGALTDTQVRALYNIGSQALSASPKTNGSHVEALETTGVLAQFAALEGTDLVDMAVSA